MKLHIAVAFVPGLALADKISDSKRADEPIYYRGQCSNAIATAGGDLTITKYDEATTVSACNQRGGRFCDRGCVITGDETTRHLTNAAWKDACEAAGADEDDLFGDDFYNKEEIEDLAGC